MPNIPNPYSEFFREPNLLIPGNKPIGPVKVDWGVAPPGLINYWLFGTNDRRYDLTGKYRTTCSSPLIEVLDGERAAEFTAADGNEYSASGVIETGAQFSVLMRIYIPTGSFATGNPYIFGGYGTSSTTDKLSLLGYSNDNIYYDYGDTSAGRINTSIAAHYDKWTDIAFTTTNVGSGYKAIYFDGVEQTFDYTPDAPSGDVDNFTIGSWPGGSDDFTGYKSYLMFFNKELTPEDVVNIPKDPYYFLIPA